MLNFNTHNGFDTFESEPGVHRVLSLMPPKPKAMRRVGDVFPIIDKQDWFTTKRKQNLSSRMPRYDQKSIGQCEPTAEVECIGGLRAIAGLPPVALSPSMLYTLIGDGADNGASLGDGYSFLLQYGVCRQETMPSGQLFRRSEITQAAFQEARLYKAILGFHCPTFAEIVTAIYHDCWVAHGVVVGGDFNNLTREGVAPQPHNQPPNHAVSAWDVIQLADGQWALDDLNHWTRQWGDDGDFRTTEEDYESQQYRDAIAYQVVTIDADFGTLIAV